MGLDNGIIIRKINKKDIPSFVNDGYKDVSFDMKNTAEIAYWRKCWGIRQAIIDKFHLDYYEGSEIKMEKEDISALIKILYKFLDREYWNENADSIWEYEEMIDTLFQQIINLKWLEIYIDEHPEIEVVFYDSF